jgi:CheY-like chemotaxis protein
MSDMPPADPMLLRGKRILVVEDEFLILLDIQGILEAAGARSVITASRIDDALAAIISPDGFDAAVLDLKLEKDSSIPVAEKLTAEKVPFVFLTGAPDDADIAHDFKSVPIIGKPFDSAVLLTALQKAMSSRQ